MSAPRNNKSCIEHAKKFGYKVVAYGHIRNDPTREPFFKYFHDMKHLLTWAELHNAKIHKYLLIEQLL